MSFSSAFQRNAFQHNAFQLVALVPGGSVSRADADRERRKRRIARERATQETWKRKHDQRIAETAQAKARAEAKARAAIEADLAALGAQLADIAAERQVAIAADDEQVLLTLVAATEAAVEADELTAARARLGEIAALLTQIASAYAPIVEAAQAARDDEESLILLLAA